MENTNGKARLDEYRGAPLIVLPLDGNREFSFGLAKARELVKPEVMDDIKSFYDSKGFQPALKSGATKLDEYRGSPLIAVAIPGKTFPFSFGLGKAGAIIEHAEEIRKFVAQHDSNANDAQLAGYVAAGLGEDKW